jgi:K+-transporting ATPase ATPase A chain
MTAVAPDLSFNTAISFITNTNWQNYGGESTMSYLVQMLGLTHQNFLSAATGIVLAVALIRGFSRGSARTVGNFWIDITRCTLYILIPICIPYALFLVWQGLPQTLGSYVDVTTMEGAKQTIAVGPVASVRQGHPARTPSSWLAEVLVDSSQPGLHFGQRTEAAHPTITTNSPS